MFKKYSKKIVQYLRKDTIYLVWLIGIVGAMVLSGVQRESYSLSFFVSSFFLLLLIILYVVIQYLEFKSISQTEKEE